MQANSLIKDRYVLISPLGEGGFSEVWKALDNMTNEIVALKILTVEGNVAPSALNDAVREFLSVRSLNHPNLLRIEYVDRHEGIPFLIMPLCEEGSLEKRLEEKGAIENEYELVRIMYQIALGLQYLHEKNITHNDIKPGNILINAQNHYVLTDFGISGATRKDLLRNAHAPITHEQAPKNQRVTQRMGENRATVRMNQIEIQAMEENTNAGFSPAYSAPEIFATQAFSPQSDVFSLGACMFDLATGTLPFNGNGGIVLTRGADVPQLPNNFSREFSFIVSSCMKNLPHERIALKDIITASEGYLHHKKWVIKVPKGEKVSKKVEKIKPEFDKNTPITAPKSKAKWLITAVIALILAASSVATWYIWQKSKPVPIVYDVAYFNKSIGDKFYGDTDFKDSNMISLLLCGGLETQHNGKISFTYKIDDKRDLFGQNRNNRKVKAGEECPYKAQIYIDGDEKIIELPAPFGKGTVDIAGSSLVILGLNNQWKFTTFKK